MRTHWSIGTALILVACGADASPAEFTTGSSSSGADPTTTTTTTSETSGDSNTATLTTLTTDADSSSEVSSDTDAATTSTSATGSTGPDCPLGSLGCPCDGKTCESDALCVEGTCEALSNCNVDGYEPNDDEDSAVDLGELADGDDPGSVAGELDHALDVDWFTYAGIDELGIGPGVAPLRDLAADGALRLCKFLECPSGIVDTEVMCPEGSELSQSPSGRPGCCSSLSIAMPDFNCSGTTDDSAQVYIRLDNAVEQCVQYTVGYEY